MRGIPEPPLPPSDPELEKTIAELIDRMEAAREGSAAHRLAVRELEGLVSDREHAQEIMEDMGVLMNGRRSAEPTHPKMGPGQILRLSRPRRRTSGSPS